MRVGVLGLGKLGLPVALTLEQAGHEIIGWDASDERLGQILTRHVPECGHEPHLAEFLSATQLRVLPVAEMVEADPDIILVCVQTPHDARFEGVTPLEDDPQDFDYSYLRDAICEIGVAVDTSNADPLVVIVSTCLPGTFERELRPLQFDLRLAYHPLFIAMGSVVEDFRNPEFVLVGTDLDDGEYGAWELAKMYVGRHGEDTPEVFGPDVPWQNMSITSAELTKVAYNAAIGFKLLLANTVAEISDRVGANADDVMDTLKLATKRLVSPAYMTPGMGDGGGCHPRDQIALAWLAEDLDLYQNPFASIVRNREAHAEWLADTFTIEADSRGLPPVILGGAYKPNTHMRTGSHALLVAHYVSNDYPVFVYDDPPEAYPLACYFLATPHDHFLNAPLPSGSVVVDPWGVFPERDGVDVIRLGRRA